MKNAVNRAIRPMGLAVGLTLTLALVAACGGSSSSEASSPEASSAAPTSESAAASPAAAAASEAPAELTKVTMVQPWVIQGEEAGQIAAVREGFYADEGLEVEIVPGGPDVRAGALLASGSADFAILSPVGVFTNRIQDIPIVGVAGINQADGIILMCKSSTGIKGFGDLAGKKVGVWIGGGEAGVQAAAVQSGVRVEDVEWLPQKFSMEEFFQDQFDCASAMEWNEKHIVYNEGYKPGETVNELRSADVGIYLPGDSIATLESTVADRPEVVQGIVTGTMRGWQWTCSSEENQNKAAQYTVDMAPDLDLGLQVIQVQEMCALIAQGPAADAGSIGVLATKSWQSSADAALSAGQLEAPADVAASFTDKFVNAVPEDYKKITW